MKENFREIWKFPLRNDFDRQVIAMPQGAEILSLQMQCDTPTIWAIVDTRDEQEDRAFICTGTGLDLGQHGVRGGKYLATVQAKGGLVWHWFELRQP
jgi:hypothetical protein